MDTRTGREGPGMQITTFDTTEVNNNCQPTVKSCNQHRMVTEVLRRHVIFFFFLQRTTTP